jgi:hypothetical protein
MMNTGAPGLELAPPIPAGWIPIPICPYIPALKWPSIKHTYSYNPTRGAVILTKFAPPAVEPVVILTSGGWVERYAIICVVVLPGGRNVVLEPDRSVKVWVTLSVCKTSIEIVVPGLQKLLLRLKANTEDTETTTWHPAASGCTFNAVFDLAKP